MASNVAFVNVTRQCNVDCQRCYLTPEHRSGGERLPEAILRAFFDHPFWADESLIIWEGGEPVATGSAFMREMVAVAKEVVPHARQTMVTNCYSVPTWLIDLAHDQFGSKLETTFAMGLKSNLAGDETAYREAFTKGLNRFWEAGVSCPVNVELNAETVAAGVDALASYILSTKAKVWEFDLSVDFESFLAAPSYSARSTPALKPTVSYSTAWGFLAQLKERWHQAFLDAGIVIGAFEQIPGEANGQFNVLSEHRFLTLNPDGSVTTNPLYSDLVGTFLGNLGSSTMDQILSSPRRTGRIVDERRRLLSCSKCPHRSYCRGGPAHVPVYDGSGECAGGMKMWTLLEEGMKHCA